mmetsp:Transcript_58344/g.185961  ORF Transcript_58344/g.185961 Transcript_58344/m.185961 type:complete len:209 (+) Transcript_58344:156-782(+)
MFTTPTCPPPPPAAHPAMSTSNWLPPVLPICNCASPPGPPRSRMFFTLVRYPAPGPKSSTYAFLCASHSGLSMNSPSSAPSGAPGRSLHSALRLRGPLPLPVCRYTAWHTTPPAPPGAGTAGRPGANTALTASFREEASPPRRDSWRVNSVPRRLARNLPTQAWAGAFAAAAGGGRRWQHTSKEVDVRWRRRASSSTTASPLPHTRMT